MRRSNQRGSSVNNMLLKVDNSSMDVAMDGLLQGEGNIRGNLPANSDTMS